MSKQAFAKSIINKMKAAISTDGSGFNNGTANLAMTAVAQAITEYLLANTTVTIAYAGIVPGTPPSPDPVVVDTFKIVGACAPLSPSQSFDTWLLQLQNNIIAGFMLAPAGNSGVVFVQKPFLSPGITVTQAQIKSAAEANDDGVQEKVWEVICDGIMQWINSTAMNPAPGGATRPGSAGTANITMITIT